MKFHGGIWCLALLLAGVLAATDFAGPGSAGPAAAGAEQPLLVDSDFSDSDTYAELRRLKEPRSWYESRNDGTSGPKLLMLSKKNIGGNDTHKAMIKADPKYNTYVSQEFSRPLTGPFSLQWDIYVREILPPFNRTAFQMIGNTSVKGKGPNATGRERFVFLGFMNGEIEGTINLFAFEGGEGGEWDDRTVLVRGLDLKEWYTIRVDGNVEKDRYEVSVVGVTEEPVRVKAYKTKRSPIPESLTHISFASWNDGPGTFYVDNVLEP